MQVSSKDTDENESQDLSESDKVNVISNFVRRGIFPKMALGAWIMVPRIRRKRLWLKRKHSRKGAFIGKSAVAYPARTARPEPTFTNDFV